MNITVLLWVVDILCYLIVTPFLKLCNGVLWELQQAIQSLMKECNKDTRISSEYDDEVQSTSYARNYKPHPQYPTPPNNFALEKFHALKFSLNKRSFISCIKCLFIPLKLFYMTVLFLRCFNPLKRHFQSSTSMYLNCSRSTDLLQHEICVFPIKLSD